MNWYLEVLKKYVVFKGRARRKEYWYFILFNAIAAIIITIADVIIGTYNPVTQTGILSSLYSLGVLLPSLAVTIRRLHDTNRSGWWILFPLGSILLGTLFMVLIGGLSDPDNMSTGAGMIMVLVIIAMFASFITLFVFMVLNGTAGSNTYGTDPKNNPEPEMNAQQIQQKIIQKTQGNEMPHHVGAAQGIVLQGKTALSVPITLNPNSETSIGRSPSANVNLNNAYISGQHLSLKYAHGNSVTVKDLGSTNGSYIDGQRLDPHVPYTLRPGQRLILGSEDIVYTLA